MHLFLFVKNGGCKEISFNVSLHTFYLNTKCYMNLCINTRDELHIINLDNVAYLKANGNFTEFHLLDNTIKVLLPCLSDYEIEIKKLYMNNTSPFLRTGRSYIINTLTITSIYLHKQIIYFKPANMPPLLLSKTQLHRLKDYLAKQT